VADVPWEDLDVTQPTHDFSAPTGRFARTVAEQVRVRVGHETLVARRATYRQAQALVGDLAEQLGQLGAPGPDPSERLELLERARDAIGTIVRILAAPAASIPVVRHSTRDADQLDEWVQLLDELLTDAQVGYVGAHGRALALAASIAVSVEQLGGVEPRAEARA
jgi:hypothetical protein